MKYFISFILTLLLAGCNLFQGKQPAGESAIVEEKQVETFVPVQKELYVIKDVVARYATLRDSVPSLFAIMGDKFEIVAEGKKFYKTKRDYIEKGDMGDWETLKSKITKEVLIESIDGDVADVASKHLNISCVSYEEYEGAFRDKVDFLQKDTLTIIKKNGKLTFVCKHKTVYLKDDISELADKHFDTTYTYLGNNPVLDQYVVLENTERAYAYILIDKTTGEKRRFEKFPFLSVDKKYIINIGRDYYNWEGIISLYRIKSIKPFEIDTLVNGNTKWWTTYDLDKEPIFFSKNGFLYAPMNVRSNFFDEHYNPNKQRMYIKVGIRN